MSFATLCIDLFASCKASFVAFLAFFAAAFAFFAALYAVLLASLLTLCAVSFISDMALRTVVFSSKANAVMVSTMIMAIIFFM